MSTQRQHRQQELEALRDIINTPGYELQYRDCTGLLQNLRDSSATDCATGEQWMERRGKILMLEQLIMYPQAAMSELELIEAGELEFDDETPDVPKNTLEA